MLVTISRSKPAFSHHALGIASEQAVGGGGVSRNGAPRLAGGGRASQGRAGADQVVDDHRHASLHRAHEQVLTAHHAAAPPFLHEGQRHVGRERAGERFAQQLRTLGPARVRRDDDHRLLAQQRQQVGDEQRARLEVDGRAPKGVLERRKVVHVDHHHSVDPDRLDQLGDIARRDRVPELGSPILPCVGEVRDDGGHAPGTGIANRAGEEQ